MRKPESMKVSEESGMPMRAPDDWHAYMSFFGCWCSAFGQDVRITFVHESFIDFRGYSTALRFMISPLWPSWKKNVSKESEVPSTADEADDDALYRLPDGHIIYSLALKHLWARRHEAKAIVAKAVMSDISRAIPFVSVPVWHRSKMGKSLEYRKDMLAVSKLFHKLPHVIGSWIYKQASRPAPLMDIRVVIRAFRKIINYSVTCNQPKAGDLLNVALNTLWKISEWRDIIEGPNYTGKLTKEIIVSADLASFEQKGMFYNVQQNAAAAVSSISYRLPTCILWNAPPTSAVFRFKSGEIVRVSWAQIHDSFTPAVGHWEDWIRTTQGLDLTKLRKEVINMNDKREKLVVEPGQKLGSIEIVCEYEGGGSPSPNMLKEFGLVWLINCCFSQQALNNGVMAGVSLGDWPTRELFSGYVEEIDPRTETPYKRLERLCCNADANGSSTTASPSTASPSTTPPCDDGSRTTTASTGYSEKCSPEVGAPRPHEIADPDLKLERGKKRASSVDHGRPSRRHRDEPAEAGETTAGKCTFRLTLKIDADTPLDLDTVKDVGELEQFMGNIEWFRNFCLRDRSSSAKSIDQIWGAALTHLSYMLTQKCNQILWFLSGDTNNTSEWQSRLGLPLRNGPEALKRCRQLLHIASLTSNITEWCIDPWSEKYWIAEGSIDENLLRSMMACLTCSYPQMYPLDSVVFNRRWNPPLNIKPCGLLNTLDRTLTPCLNPPSLYALLSCIMQKLSQHRPMSVRVETAMEMFLRKIVKPCIWAPLILHCFRIQGPVPRRPASPSPAPSRRASPVLQDGQTEPWYTRLGRRRYIRKKLEKVAVDIPLDDMARGARLGQAGSTASSASDFEEGECD